jgi:uncharacterized membrane protein
MLEIISSIILPSLIAAFGWGIAPIFDKLALNNLDNNYFSVILYKFIFGGVLSVFLLFIGFKKVFKFKLDNKKHIKGLIFILLSSITTFLLGNLFYLKALSQAKYTVEIVIITYVLPIFIVSLLSYIFFKEKFNLKMIIGVILAITGITVFLYGSHYDK